MCLIPTQVGGRLRDDRRTRMEKANVLQRLIPKRLKKRLREYVRYHSYFAAVAGRAANVDAIAKRLKLSCRPVECPLIMVSQVERSGGSLMAQLFDGHPDLLAHPHELKIGYPDKRDWPPMGLPNLDKQFRVLFELDNIDFCENGYVKGQYYEARQNFFLVPHIQRELFREAMKKAQGRTSRDVLNAYFTSYFNAWLNMRGRIERAKFVTGFVPMLAARKENMDEFWRAYPDGFLISIVRSPLSWHPSFVSLKGDAPEFSDVKVTAARWNASTEAMFRELERMIAQRLAIRRSRPIATSVPTACAANDAPGCGLYEPNLDTQLRLAMGFIYNPLLSRGTRHRPRPSEAGSRK